MNISVHDFYPPILGRIARRIASGRRPKNAEGDDALFEGDDALFKREAALSTCYGEYGMGTSTQWVLRNTSAKVVAVDTSQHWVQEVERQNQSDRLDAKWIDVGVLADWGRPLSYTHRHAFTDYITSIWTRGIKPDLVLVDGRFRVCCFLQSMLSAKPGTRIIFDDYMDRPWYHVVEEIAARLEVCGRQALFEVAEDKDTKAIEQMRDHFLYVLD